MYTTYGTHAVHAIYCTRTRTRTHDEWYNARIAQADRRTYTHTRTRYTAWAVQVEHRTARTHAESVAHKLQYKSDRTSRPSRKYAAAQHRTKRTRPYPSPVRVLYTRLPHSHAPMNTHVRSYVHRHRNPRAVRSQMGYAGNPRGPT